MCIIIIKQKSEKIPMERLKTSARINPHGLGIVWLDTFELTYQESKDYAQLHTERPFIAHFRYATVGKINRENMHPFVCGKNRDELLMMNGTIRGLGDAETCDTKVQARMLGDMPRSEWKAELEQHEARFVSINRRTRTFQIYNRDAYFKRDGVWYSKANVLEDHVIGVYGTLKKNYSNYNRYLRSSKYLGRGKTVDKYPLLIQGLPYLIEEKGVGHNVEIDIFKVDDSKLLDLDRLEGHPNWYRRKQVPIKLNSGKVVTCWVYFNLKERPIGSQMHQSYTQQVYKPSTYTFRDQIECTQQMIWDDAFETEDDFDALNESPMCVNCYSDLVVDEHEISNSSYHCPQCNESFTEQEVVVNL